MIIGKLRHRIEIQTASEAADSLGQMTKTWTTAVTRYAAIEPLSGRELIQAQQVNSEITHKVTLRYYAVTSKMRFKFGSRYFEIMSVINKEERNLETVCMCKEAV